MGTDNQRNRGHTQSGTIKCTFRGHRQPVRQRPTAALSSVHTEGTGNQPGLGNEGTYNQTDSGHTQWITLGHCQLYIQRTQTTSQTGHTGALSTVSGNGLSQPAGGKECWAQTIRQTGTLLYIQY